eukprot:12936994-Prorocentrum_lima.AAC.1
MLPPEWTSQGCPQRFFSPWAKCKVDDWGSRSGKTAYTWPRVEGCCAWQYCSNCPICRSLLLTELPTGLRNC